MDLNHGRAIEYFTGAKLQALSLSKRGTKLGDQKRLGRGAESLEGLRSVSRAGEEKEIGSLV